MQSLTHRPSHFVGYLQSKRMVGGEIELGMTLSHLHALQAKVSEVVPAFEMSTPATFFRHERLLPISSVRQWSIPWAVALGVAPCSAVVLPQRTYPWRLKYSSHNTCTCSGSLQAVACCHIRRSAGSLRTFPSRTPELCLYCLRASPK